MLCRILEKRRKIVSIIAALFIISSCIAFVACNTIVYKITYIVDAEVYYETKANVNTPWQHVDFPKDPQKEGYIFEGWEDKGGSLFTPKSEVTIDITLYAKFKKIGAEPEPNQNLSLSLNRTQNPIRDLRQD